MKFIAGFYLVFLIGHAIAPQASGLGLCSESSIVSGPYDIVISEIYPDPTPSVGLPQVEFVEIYNRSDQTIDLGQLRFVNSTTEREIPSYFLPPQAYALLTDLDDTAELNIYGITLGIKSFTALTNTRDDLYLVDSDGVVIHSVSYDQSWYGDGAKEDGGYSLEMINLQDPCAGSSNWTASNSIIGGTPAALNSVNSEDFVSPFELVSVVPDEDQVRLIFSKQVTLGEGLSIDISPSVDFEIRGGESASEIVLELGESLSEGVEYVLTFAGWMDCLGQLLETSSTSFLLPQLPEAGDLLINEILFNPQVGGSDYVEIINRSSKYVSLEGLYLVSTQAPAEVEGIEGERIIAPNEIVVFTEDPNDISARYSVPRPENLVRQDLPTLPDSEGNLTFYRVQGRDQVILDAFDYSSDYHVSLLKDKNGVSLERVSTSGETNNSSTWQSAAESAGFGTPTEVNSQSGALAGDEQFELAPRVFSPDGDGVADFLQLHYSFPESGYISNIRVYDAAGRLIHDWINQSSLGVTGSIKWDGTVEDGLKAPLGIYTVSLESFRESGKIIRWKETCVLASQLN